jgi:DUF2911 family protein
VLSAEGTEGIGMWSLARRIVIGAAVCCVAGSAAMPVAAYAQGASGGGGGGGEGKPLLSPRDTTRATVGSAHLLVDYGRPSKRGRQIFGGLVPYGEVWRTGANAATTFVTDRDLVVASVTVPAGTYTLFSVPAQSAGGWKLVINKQTKQWGTEYHQDQDLGRASMTTTSISPPVEQFTIKIVPKGSGGGELQYVWDTTQASVPFTVK